MNFKKIVKVLSTKLFMAQDGFATHLYVSFPAINRWKTGMNELTIKIKRKIVTLCKENKVDLEKK